MPRLIKHNCRQFLFFLLFLFLSSILIYFIFFSKIFNIQKINCLRDNQICSSELLAELNNYQNKNIFLLAGGKIRNKLIAADQTIRKIETKFRLPGTLSVIIVSRYPAIRIANSLSASNYLLADEDGIILSIIDSDKYPDLPVLIWENAPQLDIQKPPSVEVKNAIQIINLLKEKLAFISPAVLDQFTLTVTLKNGTIVLFSTQEDNYFTQLKTLQVVLDETKIKNMSYHQIDLRFRNPIIKNN